VRTSGRIESKVNSDDHRTQRIVVSQDALREFTTSSAVGTSHIEFFMDPALASYVVAGGYGDK
jgi:hypothetical protein